MGTRRTALQRIDKLRSIVRGIHDRGERITKRKLIAQMILRGQTKRGALELIQAFIDADEFLLEETDGVEYINFNAEIVLKNI